MTAPAPGTSSSSASTRSSYVARHRRVLLVAALVVFVVLVLYNLVDDHLDDVRTGKTFLSSSDRRPMTGRASPGAVRDRDPRRRPRRPPRPARAHPLRRRLRQRRLGLRHRARLPRGARRVLARRVRLARPSKRDEPYEHHRVVLDDVPDPLPRGAGRGPAPLPLILSHGWPWTFWDFHKVIGPLVRPGGARRRSRRRVRRRRAVAPRLRLLVAAADTRRDPGGDRRAVGAADARRARLRPLRRPGRRLGRVGDRVARARARRAPRRRAPVAARVHHPRPAARSVPTTTGPTRRTGTSGPAGSADHRRAHDSCTGATRRRSRPRSTTRRPGWPRGSSSGAGTGATATATSSAASPRTTC